MNPIQRLIKSNGMTYLRESNALSVAVQFVVNFVGKEWKPSDIAVAIPEASKRFGVSVDQIEAALEKEIGVK